MSSKARLLKCKMSALETQKRPADTEKLTSLFDEMTIHVSNLPELARGFEGLVINGGEHGLESA